MPSDDPNTPAQQPPEPTPEPTSPASPPTSGQPPEQPPMMPPAYPPAYGTPAYPSYPSYPAYPPVSAPGASAPPSQPLWPGYAAPPTGPYGSYDPTQQQPYPPTWQPSYPPYPPYPPYAPPPPAQPPSRRRTGLIAGVISGGVALLLVVCCITGSLLVQQANSDRNSVLDVPTVPVPTLAPTPTFLPTPSGSTATPGSTTTSGGGTVVYTDTLTDSPNGWLNDANCFPKSDGYHVKSSGCPAPILAYSNVDIVVQLEQVSGPTDYPYGVYLRDQTSGNKFYSVMLDSDGEWEADRCSGTTTYQGSSVADCKALVGPKSSSAIHKGRGTSNTLEVRATGSSFTVYINKTKVGTFTDSSYASGYIGFETTINMEAVYKNLTVSLLS